MRQMTETIRVLHEQIAMQSLAQRTMKAIADTPPQVDALCTLAYALCDELAPSDKFEIGLYVGEQIHIRVAVTADARLPPMSIPRTLLWEWLAECHEPVLCKTSAQLAALPVVLPPISQGISAQSVMFLPLSWPIDGEGQADASEPRTLPLGAIILQSTHPQAFQERDMSRLATVAERIGAALGAVRPPRPAAVAPAELHPDDQRG
jgi:hypothetical protein